MQGCTVYSTFCSTEWQTLIETDDQPLLECILLKYGLCREYEYVEECAGVSLFTFTLYEREIL